MTGGPPLMERQGLGCAPVAGMIVAGVTLLLWALHLAMLSDLNGSDAAGNGMAQGFTAIAIVLLWVLLAGLLILAGAVAEASQFAIAPALVLLPLSGFAAMTALNLLSHPGSPPYFWPIVVSATAPPLIVLFCLWALIPSARAAIPVWIVAGVVWGATLIVSVSVWPMSHIRAVANARQQEIREKWDADFARLPHDAPLWDWTPFLATAMGNTRDAVVDRIRHLDRRQDDAEVMLERGDFPLLYLGWIDLAPTQKICDSARALLRKQVAPLVLKQGESKPYAAIRREVSGAVASMQWLVGYDCSCDAEALAWETMANAYRNTEFDVVELRRVRDPKVLGRTLRENPEHFSMLSSRSHLMAWLQYANDETLREQALAGARTLEHRTGDAVDMLNGTEYVAWDLLIYLPGLDLEATPSLCDAALREVHRELAQIYRPRSDDPRPYQELLERMGTGRPLPALMWLAAHGCDTEAAVDEAEALVASYRDSPDRTAMLATLGALHRKR